MNNDNNCRKICKAVTLHHWKLLKKRAGLGTVCTFYAESVMKELNCLCSMMCSVPWPESVLITFKKQACEDGMILPPEHSVVLIIIILIHNMMGKVNQLNEFSDVVAWLLDETAYSIHHMHPVRTSIFFFGSPDLSLGLNHFQWLVICYVVLNLYTHIYSDPLAICIRIFRVISY
jgi:hypothetical protein